MKNRTYNQRFSIFFFFLLISLSQNALGQSSDENWWENIARVHMIEKQDYRVFRQSIIFSDSISESDRLIDFKHPILIVQEKENYTIFKSKDLALNKNDSIIESSNVLSISFKVDTNRSYPTSISEYAYVKYNITSGLIFVVEAPEGFFWIDETYNSNFDKKTYKIGIKTSN